MQFSGALGDVFHFPAALNNPAGSGGAGTAPTWAVRLAGAAASAAPIATGTATLLTNAGFRSGSYEVEIDTSLPAFSGVTVTDTLLIYFTAGIDGENPVGSVGVITFEGAKQKSDLSKVAGTDLPAESTGGNYATNLGRWLDGNNSQIDATEQHIASPMTETQNNQIGYRLGLNRTTSVPTSAYGTLDLLHLHIGVTNDADEPLLITTGPASTAAAVELKVGSAGSRVINISAPAGNTQDLVTYTHSGSGGVFSFNTINASTGHVYKYSNIGTQFVDDEDNAFSPTFLSTAWANPTSNLTGAPSDTATHGEILRFLLHKFAFEEDQSSSVGTLKDSTGGAIATRAISQPVAGTVRRGKLT